MERKRKQICERGHGKLIESSTHSIHPSFYLLTSFIGLNVLIPRVRFLKGRRFQGGNAVEIGRLWNMELMEFL